MSDKPKPVLFLFDPNTSTAAEMFTEIKLGIIKSGLSDEEKVALERLIGEHGKSTSWRTGWRWRASSGACELALTCLTGFNYPSSSATPMLSRTWPFMLPRTTSKRVKARAGTL